MTWNWVGSWLLVHHDVNWTSIFASSHSWIGLNGSQSSCSLTGIVKITWYQCNLSLVYGKHVPFCSDFDVLLLQLRQWQHTGFVFLPPWIAEGIGAVPYANVVLSIHFLSVCVPVGFLVGSMCTPLLFAQCMLCCILYLPNIKLRTSPGKKIVDSWFTPYLFLWLVHVGEINM